MPPDNIPPAVVVPLLIVMGAALFYLYRSRITATVRWMGFKEDR